MNTRALWPALLLITSGGCSLLKVDTEIQQARVDLVQVVGKLLDSPSGRSALVALLNEQGKLQNYRIAAPGELFYFTLPPGSYQLLAFDDRNGNFRLDADEPRHWQPQATTSALQIQPSQEQRERLSQANLISLATDDLAPAPALDLSLDLLYREQPRLQRNYLQVVGFADPRFDPAQVQLGSWQPLTFMHDIGYGLYLLEPWDAKKEPIVLVHGINSSPRTLQALAASIDTRRFQLLLYHFPGGLPLNNSAYMLGEAMGDVLRRLKPTRMHVLSHSMGGLVARRAVQLLSEADSQQLCLFISLSTPWDGHPSAASGVDNIPLDIPIWRDMAPGSAYLQTLFASPLPAPIRQWMLVSYAGHKPLLGELNDGVVPLASELRSAAQDEAAHLYLLNENHTSILASRRTAELLARAFDSLPAKGCD
ncbi:MAG: alpha/beta hydrolase [Pseudomonas sp.]|uniref:alpha/beta hydrolase n=1 Tax=Pseudomonas sp. TaxID=306 RepID=UPI0033975ADD